MNQVHLAKNYLNVTEKMLNNMLSPRLNTLAVLGVAQNEQQEISQLIEQATQQIHKLLNLLNQFNINALLQTSLTQIKAICCQLLTQLTLRRQNQPQQEQTTVAKAIAYQLQQQTQSSLDSPQQLITRETYLSLGDKLAQQVTNYRATGHQVENLKTHTNKLNHLPSAASVRTQLSYTFSQWTQQHPLAAQTLFAVKALQHHSLKNTAQFIDQLASQVN